MNFLKHIVTAILLMPVEIHAEDALPVEIVRVELSQTQGQISFVGVVAAAKSYPEAFRTGGRIVEIAVEIGDTLPAGSLVARINSAAAEASRDAALASLRSSEAFLAQAKRELTRTQGLLERGTATRVQLDNAEGAVSDARANRERISISAERALQAVSDSELRTSVETIVIDRRIEVGEIVGPGQEVVKLAIGGKKEAIFYFPDVGGLHRIVGLVVSLEVAGQVSFKSLVSQVSSTLSTVGTVEVRVPIPDERSSSIPFGSQIAATIIRHGDPVVTLPSSALTEGTSGPAVWVANPTDSTVSLQPIVLQGFGNETIYVRSGLEDGQLVVGEGSYQLVPGRTVKPAGEE